MGWGGVGGNGGTLWTGGARVRMREKRRRYFGDRERVTVGGFADKEGRERERERERL